ncbi:retrovirus-related pol polyprotein from transposon TNT 1-94 [Tanacetum coccineum]|uniref:Retrovirus-related pol polyprotein from transposon TNT 1-94 n=1 Tax=Tanacetum coccineum TaxID=301880 RepID=A0ABQ5BV40_9ASTR
MKSNSTIELNTTTTMAMFNLFKGARDVLTRHSIIRQFSKRLGPDSFDNYIIRRPVKGDYKAIVKGIHKFLTKPESNTEKSKSGSSFEGKRKKSPTKWAKGSLSNKDIEKMAAQLQDYCWRNPYMLAIAGVKSDKIDTRFSKVCGAAGLMMNAEEVKEFKVKDQKWMPKGRYALICNLWVLLEARLRGIGTALVEHLVERARNEGVKIIYAVVDRTKTGPLKLHLDVGFKEVARNDETNEVLFAKAVFKGPSDTKENRIMDLKLEYQTFRAKSTESLSQTYTRYKTLLNELANDGVNLSKHEINVSFMNSLPEKWLTFSQGLRNANHTQTLDLADIYGRFFYEDFQENSDDKVDERSSEEYLKDLDIEYHERALLANSKRFIIRRNNFSGQKANENIECYKCGKKGYFARDCFSKTSKPSYKSPENNYSSVSKGFQPKIPLKLIHSSSNLSNQANLKFQKDYKIEYKKTFQPKNKGFVAETFDWDEEEVFDDKEVTRVKVLMALAYEELTVGKSHARNGEWVDITIRKVNTLLSMDEDADWQNYLKYINIDLKFVEEQGLNLLSKYNKIVFELNKSNPHQKKKVLGGKVFTESSSKMNENENLFIPASMGFDQEMVPKAKDWVERLNPDSKLLNFNTGIILVPESQAVNESLKTTNNTPEPPKDSEAEFLTPLPPLKNLQGALPNSEIIPLTFQPHFLRERPGLGIIKYTKPETQDSLVKSVSGIVTVSETEPATSSVPTKVKNTKLESKLNELTKLVQMVIDEKAKPIKKPQLKCELFYYTNHSTDDCYMILYCMKCKREDHRTSYHEMYIALLKRSENYKALPYQYASPSKQILKAKAKPFPPCTHCGFNDHIPDDYRNYSECEICGSYDHFTSRYNRVIHIRGGVLAESSQSSESSIGVKCNTCGSIRHIREPIWYLDSGCSRSMTGVKSYLHKYVEQPSPKLVFGDNSSCITEGYGSINCGGIVLTKVAFVNGLKYNLISISQLSLRRNDVYVLDMSSLTLNGACFFSKALESENWLWHKRLSHLNFKSINKLAKQNKVLGLPSLVYSKDKPCSACEKGRHHKASFKTKQNLSIIKCLHILYMDLFRPVSPMSINHEKYTLVIVDEYSRSIIVKRHDKTSYEIFKERIPDISYFHVFGCPVFIHNHKDHLGKFDAKADDGYFLGYSSVSKAFRVYNTRRQQIEETYHVTFDEGMEAIRFINTLVDEIGIDDSSRYPLDEFLHEDDPSRQYQVDFDISYYVIPHGQSLTELTQQNHVPELIVPNEPDVSLTEDTEDPPDLLNIKGIHEQNFLMHAYKKHDCQAYSCLSALKHRGWIDAMQEELNQFYRNKEDGIDYDETFAPVVRMEAIRIFLAFATYMNFKVYQIDVKSASLNGKLKEEVYVKQSPSFESSEFLDYVCKLDKAL